MTRQPSREVLTERVLSQPAIESASEVIDETSALAVLEDIKQNNKALYDHLQIQIEDLDISMAQELGDSLSPLIRRGIIARAAIAGATQAVNDIGHSFIQADKLKESLGLTA